MLHAFDSTGCPPRAVELEGLMEMPTEVSFSSPNITSKPGTFQPQDVFHGVGS